MFKLNLERMKSSRSVLVFLAGFFEEKNLAYRLVKCGREGNGTVVAGMKKRMTMHNRQKSKAEIK